MVWRKRRKNDDTFNHFTIVWPCIVTDSLWIKPTGALNYNFIGITTLHVSDSLSAHHQEFLVVHRHCYIFADLMTAWYQKQDGIKSAKMYQCRCTTKNSWWWAEMLSETCRLVIPIKLEFSASVGFIHKELIIIFLVKLNVCHRMKRIHTFLALLPISEFQNGISHSDGKIKLDLFIIKWILPRYKLTLDRSWTCSLYLKTVGYIPI
jgi:hypothetical protein